MNSFSHNSKKSLLCVYYTQQLLAGLAAVISFRRYQGKSLYEPLTVLVWNHPKLNKTVWKRRRDAFILLLSAFPEVQLIFLSQNETKLHLSHKSKVLLKAEYLRNKFGTDIFGYIYYAHDISSDFIAQSAMQAFPNAKRICFGDSLGVFYSHKYFNNLMYTINKVNNLFRSPYNFILNIMLRAKRAWLLPPKISRLDAEYIVPILPCNPGGDFFANKILHLVDKETLQYTLSKLSEAVANYKLGEQKSIFADFTRTVVILLGAFSESGLTSEEQECALYMEVARLHINPGNRIVLKAHPVVKSKKIKYIAQALAATYEVVLLNHFEEIPIEMISYIKKCAKIISFSYATVSLLYLYGLTIVHALNDSLISKFFPNKTQKWVRDSNKLYLDQVKNLMNIYDKKIEQSIC